MRVIFCNIAYMSNYCGVTEIDKPQNGGKYIEENEDGGECYNFLDYNGKCYGYFMHHGEQVHIERIEGVSASDDFAEDVTVIWTAKSPIINGTVIVGWYRNADVFREWQFINGYRLGISRNFNIVADSCNCRLLPEYRRTFEIPRASKSGAGKGIGQSAIWFAESEESKNGIVADVLSYIEDYERNDYDFINDVITEEMLNLKSFERLTFEQYIEKAKNTDLHPLEAIKCINSAIVIKEDDEALLIKTQLLAREIFRFNDAIPYAQKSFEIDPDYLDTLIMLFDIYMITEQHEKAVDFGILVIEHKGFSDLNDEDKLYLYYSISEQYMQMGKKSQAEEYFNICNEMEYASECSADIDYLRDCIAEI